MKPLRLAALLIPAVLVSACIPIHVAATDWPAVDGHIINIMDGKPVPGATVTVNSGIADFSATTTSDSNGNFRFDQHAHEEWVHSDRYDAVFPPGTITITAPAYAPFEHKLDGSMSTDAIALAPSR